MENLKEKAIDLAEDIYFCIIQEFRLPIQSFDRTEIEHSVKKIKKIANENGLNIVASKAFYDVTKNTLFSHLPHTNECEKSQKFSSLYFQISELTRFINQLNNEAYSELQYLYDLHLLQIKIEDYLGVSSKYVGKTHIESIDLSFSCETSKYKKYIRQKKKALFFKEVEQYLKIREKNKTSIYDVIASLQDKIENEFRKFDIEWLKSAILYKENYIKIIPYIHADCSTELMINDDKNFDLKAFTQCIENPEKNKEEIKNIKKEINQLTELLDLLINNSPDKKIIEKYIPYNSDSLTDTLKKILDSNPDLKEKITR